jgi:hypothetical protein
LNACRVNDAEPPASGNRAVASAYVIAVKKKISPEIANATGVSPSA